MKTTQVDDFILGVGDWLVLYHSVWHDNSDIWEDSPLRQPLVQRWSLLQRLMTITVPLLKNIGFTDSSHEELVGLFRRAWLADLGVRVASYCLQDDECDPYRFHLHTLIRHDALLSTEPGYQPLRFARDWFIFSSLRQPLWEEIERRGATQVGFPAAVLNLVHRVDRAGEGASLDSVFQRLLERLQGRVPRRERLLSMIGSHIFGFDDPVSSRSSALRQLHGQIFLTAEGRCRKYQDVFEALTKSLEGRLNIVPTAIHDGVVDELRKHLRRERLEIEFPDDFVPAAPPSQDATEVAIVLERVIEKNPKLSGYVAAFAEGKTQREIAAQLGVSIRTVQNYHQRLLKSLRELLSGK